MRRPHVKEGSGVPSSGASSALAFQEGIRSGELRKISETNRRIADDRELMSDRFIVSRGTLAVDISSHTIEVFVECRKLSLSQTADIVTPKYIYATCTYVIHSLHKHVDTTGQRHECESTETNRTRFSESGKMTFSPWTECYSVSGWGFLLLKPEYTEICIL